ncbi:acetyltransferase (GNAT) family protein [Streptomyces sp. Amel2xB2]|uniref:GNAT family N-acetyltransferase n=1 Tax=Streptomyces sp. Amel2xB2 TaxID=1305829 RepID=UPI000DBA340F|nr:GNAT family N-acetyltransferase [Streptomyces sp. Amel2xB2]RAJ71839.1 acetyltransferase (GNAT) family protein [Streptomyces sp. Amel2xB2]
MTWAIAREPAVGGDAVALHRAYLDEVVSRYYGRPATPTEIDEEFAGMSPADLTPPRGVLLVVRHRTEGGRAAGCAGVRLIGPKTAELKRVWVRPEDRRHGLGSRLLTAAEEAAKDLGATAVRLDTRGDLVEARRLYARHGYGEIPRYHDDPYAEHFFEKHLG